MPDQLGVVYKSRSFTAYLAEKANKKQLLKRENYHVKGMSILTNTDFIQYFVVRAYW